MPLQLQQPLKGQSHAPPHIQPAATGISASETSRVNNLSKNQTSHPNIASAFLNLLSPPNLTSVSTTTAKSTLEHGGTPARSGEKKKEHAVHVPKKSSGACGAILLELSL
jgi:hypothetical protein